ncbi:MAG: tRNA preQ1(34) S-adenosylmethionine ribosyltransferase-isomerase QueA [Zymomonas mobilis subsp. pomaceae]|uniref:S-adenosylmethionine:tRNA ribosyltransferase-isomerase n=1 Tax=Zymomonas mobilis subsp. pomaceae (strain ATCC 29192 / DSM 22645 / JCM 10191 / CCUG 17912 / NBRC 13757 / NCIMB 11200 / NRRL B-4491 / Barker I) TaxID=579138 RepID=F8EVA9_ZYMMT|nr:tRNA preQ1(34) S-adenosylmethionine ribosyltransferase-isomerase QueA [Zymomonas mobilis]AEI37316.1 S-adenosylmethionine/tRNA-ribosyltransferase-isomerase [Zymomonas mobilis subsp. pomaceae ATCC 29192]MDX5948684.1 tRNA preQ1(34) S-adenosylmethionine ribosyltransferase-isomerase QueA [Zymomonas mobilis subsp. pomaceae]GEB88489.1 S-adenosylmethionine:tRNA ribosyltransferase-isomerase [Zymomonas mobilis subsp. pomaceae]
MRVDLFDFNLPSESIALRPATPRESARLLQVNDTKIGDYHIGDLPDLLKAGDLLLFNDTRVIPAYLEGKKNNARISANMIKREGLRQWRAFVRNAKRLKAEDIVDFGQEASARVINRDEDGSVLFEFLGNEPVEILLDRVGQMPLPPYIANKRPADYQDRQDYQTIFAEKQGAVAAPTASLHFTENLLERLKQAHIDHAMLTLHVGAGTFLPVKVEDSRDHVMHSEWGHIDAVTANKINATKAQGGRIIAVGTTSLRLVESAADEQGIVHPFCDETDIFITPGYRFRVIDGLMTNFHLPKSTLFMLVSALMGRETMMSAYQHAIDTGYRFYSYGDSSLLLPNK